MKKWLNGMGTRFSGLGNTLLNQAEQILSGSGEPPAEPMLRLETGMHMALIRRMAVDRAGRYLVTASEDKTARIWDLTDGHLLNTLRPPIGPNTQEGKWYATAISPDGATVAVGGSMGNSWNGQNGVYLFDRASGTLHHRLGNLPNVVYHLVWSPDGRHLAVALGGRKGVRIFRTGDWQEVMADRNYDGGCYWADFDPQGRLVTSCEDGHIRLYHPASTQPMAQVKATGDHEPFGVAFSPDGRCIAVGFDDAPVVHLLDGTDLHLLYAPAPTGMDNGSLSNVAWSPDGHWLYAGGRYQHQGRHALRRWADGGRGRFQDFPLSPSVITDLHPLADGRLLFGAEDPHWGGMDEEGNRIFQQTRAMADFRAVGEHFCLSQDGGQVVFGLEQGGTALVRFSLAEGRLEPAPTADSSLKPPITVANGLMITDWRETAAPHLNGRPLSMDPYDYAHCLASAPDNKSFLLGTDGSLRRFNRLGRRSWRVEVPGAVWGVNISGDGRLAVAALGDGTIRWYRMANGRAVLALFPHRDGQRWIVWTHSGYYQASPGGEALLGWHQNQGKAQAGIFHPVSQLRESYCRPDVVVRLLETMDEQEAVRLANAERTRGLR